MPIHCKHILIVEDDESIRETLRLALEADGYSVFLAANGKEGMEKLPEIPQPCLILLDLMMPVMDGWGFVEALDSEQALATIPVVVITAFGEGDKPIRAKKIMKKPLDLDVLFDVVRQYCDGPASRAA